MDLFGGISSQAGTKSQPQPSHKQAPVAKGLMLPGPQPFPILGMDGAQERLQSYVAQNRLPHAFLFQGKEGVGKQLFARWIAWQLLQDKSFETPPTAPLDCSLYRRMMQGGHGDFLSITPETKDLSVKQIRQVVQFFRRKPMEGRWRVVIIDQAHRMNRFGANSLLKILEEPPAYCLLILIAGPAHTLLPTLVSRCSKISFQGLSRPDFNQTMSAMTDLPPLPIEQQTRVYRLAEGAPGLARRIIETDAHLMLEAFMGTCRYLTHGDFSPIPRFVRQWEVKGRDDAFEIFPYLLFSWTDYLLRMVFTRQTDQLTAVERQVSAGLSNRVRLLNWVTVLLQSTDFFRQTEVFHLDRGAILYTFFLKLYLEGAKWPVHSTSQRLFTM